MRNLSSSSRLSAIMVANVMNYIVLCFVLVVTGKRVVVVVGVVVVIR